MIEIENRPGPRRGHVRYGGGVRAGAERFEVPNLTWWVADLIHDYAFGQIGLQRIEDDLRLRKTELIVSVVLDSISFEERRANGTTYSVFRPPGGASSWKRLVQLAEVGRLGGPLSEIGRNASKTTGTPIAAASAHSATMIAEESAIAILTTPAMVVLDAITPMMVQATAPEEGKKMGGKSKGPENPGSSKAASELERILDSVNGIKDSIANSKLGKTLAWVRPMLWALIGGVVWLIWSAADYKGRFERVEEDVRKIDGLSKSVSDLDKSVVKGAGDVSLSVQKVAADLEANKGIMQGAIEGNRQSTEKLESRFEKALEKFDQKLDETTKAINRVADESRKAREESEKKAEANARALEKLTEAVKAIAPTPKSP